MSSRRRQVQEQGLLRAWLYKCIHEELRTAIDYFTIECRAPLKRYYFDDGSQTLHISITRNITDRCAVQIVKTEACETDRICLTIGDGSNLIRAHLQPTCVETLPTSWTSEDGSLDERRLRRWNISIREFDIVVSIDRSAPLEHQLQISITNLDTLGRSDQHSGLRLVDLRYVDDHSRIQDVLRRASTIAEKQLYPTLNSQPPSSLRRDTPNEGMAQADDDLRPFASQEQPLDDFEAEAFDDTIGKASNHRQTSPSRNLYDRDSSARAVKGNANLRPSPTLRSDEQTQFASQFAHHEPLAENVQDAATRTGNHVAEDRGLMLLGLLNGKSIGKTGPRSSKDSRTPGVSHTNKSILTEAASSVAAPIPDHPRAMGNAGAKRPSSRADADMELHTENISARARSHDEPDEDDAQNHEVIHNSSHVEQAAVRADNLGPDVEEDRRDSSGDATKAWCPTAGITRDFFIIPFDQKRILNQATSWLPSDHGAPLPPANIPASILRDLTSRANRSTTREPQEQDIITENASEAPDAASVKGKQRVGPDADDETASESEHRSNDGALASITRAPVPQQSSPPEYPMDDPEEDFEDEPFSWDASPVRHRQTDLPPDSSLTRAEPNQGLGVDIHEAPIVESEDEEMHDAAAGIQPIEYAVNAEAALPEMDFPSSPPVAPSRRYQHTDNAVSKKPPLDARPDEVIQDAEETELTPPDQLGPTPPEQTVQVAETPFLKYLKRHSGEPQHAQRSSAPLHSSSKDAATTILVPSTYQGTTRGFHVVAADPTDQVQLEKGNEISPVKPLPVHPKVIPDRASVKRSADESPKAKKRTKHRRLKTLFDFGDDLDGSQQTSSNKIPSFQSQFREFQRQRQSDPGPSRQQPHENEDSVASVGQESSQGEMEGQVPPIKYTLSQPAIAPQELQEVMLGDVQPAVFLLPAEDHTQPGAANTQVGSQSSDIAATTLRNASIQRTTFTSSATRRPASTAHAPPPTSQRPSKTESEDAFPQQSTAPPAVALSSQNAFATRANRPAPSNTTRTAPEPVEADVSTPPWHHSANTPFKEFMHQYVNLKSFHGQMGSSARVGQDIEVPTRNLDSLAWLRRIRLDRADDSKVKKEPEE